MSSLGDVLHTLPFVAVLRKRFPQAKISWLVHPQFAGFIPEEPIVDEIIYFDKVAFNEMGIFDKIKYFFEMRSLLHSKDYDLVIDLQGLFKSAILALMTGCKNKIGYCEMREGSGLVSKAIVGPHAADHVIERYLDVARYLGATVDKIEFPMPDFTIERMTFDDKMAEIFNNDSSKMKLPYVVLVPGARWVTKCWPTKNFGELASRLVDKGVNVFITGGDDDYQRGTEIEAFYKRLKATPIVSEDNHFKRENKPVQGELINLIGKTNIKELAVLIDKAQGYISGDTGPLFIAAAFKKPLVAIYGPTRPERTGPYGSEDACIIQAQCDCAGCLKKQCDDLICMESVTTKYVYDKYEKLMNRGK